MLILAQAFHKVRFNSRTPGGVRPTRSIRAIFAIEFQFTHPGRGATYTK